MTNLSYRKVPQAIRYFCKSKQLKTQKLLLIFQRRFWVLKFLLLYPLDKGNLEVDNTQMKGMMNLKANQSMMSQFN